MNDKLWNYFQRYKVENWDILYKNLGLEYYNIPISQLYLESIVKFITNNNIQQNIYYDECIQYIKNKIDEKLEQSCQKKGWFIRSSLNTMNNNIAYYIPSKFYNSDEIVINILNNINIVNEMIYCYKFNSKFSIYLIEWRSLNPLYEFRLFIRNSKIKAVTQYNIIGNLPFDSSEINNVLESIKKIQNVKKRYSNGILDISIYKRNALYDDNIPMKTKYIVEPLDWHPYHDSVNSILFSWNEEILQNNSNKSESNLFEFRYMKNNKIQIIMKE